MQVDERLHSSATVVSFAFHHTDLNLDILQLRLSEYIGIMPLRSDLPDVFIKEEPLYDYIHREMVKYGDEIALIESETKTSYTFKDVVQMSTSIAEGLQAAGMKKGDVALVAVPNSPEYSLFTLGVLKAGGIVSGINLLYTKYEISDRLEDCDPKFILASSDYYASVVQHSLKEYKRPINAIYITNPSPGQIAQGCKTFFSLLNFSAENPGFQFSTPVIDTREDLAFLPYSSGTTGKPKGVMLTHYNTMVCFRSFADSGYFLIPERGDTMLLVLPMFHAYGQFLMLFGLRNGNRLVTMVRFEPKLFLHNIQSYKIKQLFVVPPLMLFLAKDPLVNEYDVSSLQAVLVGAAPAGKELCEDLKARHPYVKYILQGYGMTETTCGFIMTPAVADLPMGSTGILQANFEAKVIDITNGKELGPHEDGEILVRGGAVMKGYWNRPEATAQTIDPDGWLHTGDIGHYDDAHYFYVVDRLKELIKVKGFQVPPAELEDLLLSLPGVREVAVIGLPDVKSGELPKAFVVKAVGAEKLTENDVKSFVAERVAVYKRLAHVEFIDAIPKSPSGKILRRLLKDAEMEKLKLPSKL